uniref:Uncharacterized protein n=1 Tax=Streptomyces sp. NBC_01393 TaxID=2903851 RepID=A0AAU3I9G8_9ACTN
MSSHNDMGPVGLAFAVALVLTLVFGGIWMQAEAPCSWFGIAPVKDVPARCLMHR